MVISVVPSNAIGDKRRFMMTTTERIDPRVKRTRKLLQQALLELFQEKGFDVVMDLCRNSIPER